MNFFFKIGYSHILENADSGYRQIKLLYYITCVIDISPYLNIKINAVLFGKHRKNLVHLFL